MKQLTAVRTERGSRCVLTPPAALGAALAGETLAAEPVPSAPFLLSDSGTNESGTGRGERAKPNGQRRLAQSA
ncbi:hypothetical protein chiPu_0010136 [Chiloscyllium punctatum]|uniref:Uncharacterized protein n=1 Tax=Chiloscyllium punctatum TaxID=137246 RepID=A0A401SMT3_CHIPU|nr:hypothetical protein [Chiloscyllium punctatum]